MDALQFVKSEQSGVEAVGEKNVLKLNCAPDALEAFPFA